MKKIMLISFLLVVIGTQAQVFAHQKNTHRQSNRYSDSIYLVQGPMTVEISRVKNKGRRHCFPAAMKVWLNGELSKVRVTVCRKKRGWIVSPVHIDIGRGSAVGVKKRRNRPHPVHHNNHWPQRPFGPGPFYPWAMR